MQILMLMNRQMEITMTMGPRKESPVTIKAAAKPSHTTVKKRWKEFNYHLTSMNNWMTFKSP